MVRRGRATVGVQGVRIGHAEDPTRSTGVTAVLFDGGAPVVVDVRGGASATYDLASLSLDSTFGRRWAIFFSGGSLFGLDAAAGIRDRILETGGGRSVFRNPHRIAPVSGAALFDLPPGNTRIPDYRSLGYEAARSAAPGVLHTGKVGAGAGALVGKYHGRDAAMQGGIGWAGRSLGRRGHLGALVALNAVGAVRDPANGRWIAGARGAGGRIVPPGRPRSSSRPGLGTTLTLIVTDWALDRPAMQRIAIIAHAGLGGAVVPFQSATDGDLLFVASTGSGGAPPSEERMGATADRLGSLAVACAVEAVLGAARISNRKA
ncbi:MAG: P1 family peptidase [Thermoplasmata archaeon]|jgi:L-aminopeptidase/D-esterase-like protein|nr:P1 family peptidase [Thermoplasmata archaeon]